jgi:hypothetical protein
MSDFAEIYRQLSEPFPPEAIHWRIGSKSKDGTKARLLAYLNARDVMDRLDEVVGPENWEDSYDETAKRLLCTIRIAVHDGDFVSWVAKTDGAGDTNMEGEKGGISDAFKRAAVKWGIGRYLYSLDSPWVALDERGNIPKDFDGSKFLTTYRNGLLDHINAWKKHRDEMNIVWEHLANDEPEEALAVYRELPEDVQRTLWRAPSSGSIWDFGEREKLRGLDKQKERSK